MNLEYINLIDIASRIKEIHDASNLTAADFCKTTDISSSSYSQIIGGKLKVNIDTINKVILRWGADYDPMWILFGDRDKVRDNFSVQHDNTTSLGVPNNNVLLEKMEEIGRLKEILSATKPKEIKKITVYYTDNSFSDYRLSNE